MKTNLVRLNYRGWSVPSTEEGWFNATLIAEHFGKRLDFWLKTKDTQAYVEAVMRHSNTSKRSDLIRAKRGNNGGTWLHPRLAVAFARCGRERVGREAETEAEIQGAPPLSAD